MATAEALSTKQTDSGDWTLQGGAMLGAVVGALAGVSASGELLSEPYAMVLGTLGTILGSVTCALAARFVILPAWTAMLRGSASKRA